MDTYRNFDKLNGNTIETITVQLSSITMGLG